MRQATNLKDVVLDLNLPGVSINTSATDYRLWKQLRMMRFDGEHCGVCVDCFPAHAVDRLGSNGPLDVAAPGRTNVFKRGGARWMTI
jgi:hypothetical protein